MLEDELFISRDKALSIAYEYVGKNATISHIYADLPANCHVYNAPEECYWIYYSYSDDPSILGASKVIAICKLTGMVRYNGNAHDEG